MLPIMNIQYHTLRICYFSFHSPYKNAKEIQKKIFRSEILTSGWLVLVDRSGHYKQKYFFTDPRTEHWWLMSGPGPLITLLATYLYFCNSVGPRYMRDRKPYSLKNTIMAYNISQILMSIFLVYEVSLYSNLLMVGKEV